MFAGLLSGLVLSTLAGFAVQAVRAQITERRWTQLSQIALLSLLSQTTMLIDVTLWLATGRQPSNDARPTAGMQRKMLAIRARLALDVPPEPADLGKIQYEDYRRMLTTTMGDAEWRNLAVSVLGRWKWRNRDGLAIWAAAMLMTGETATVLNRLARLNEWLFVVQDALRPGRYGLGSAAVDEWFRWHAEAASIREDLIRVARGGLPDTWRQFREALPPEDRQELARRDVRAATERGARRVLTESFQPPAPIRGPARLTSFGVAQRTR